MATKKVSEASGAALDWAVAKCNDTLGKWVGPNEKRGITKWERVPATPRYSTNWAQGGPIIEREGIDLYCNVPTNMAHEDPSWRGSWRAKYCRCGFGTEMSYGPTPLIAAMRCYVASKMGGTVEVPDELT